MMIMMMIMSRSTTDPTLRIGASTICNRAAAKENFQPIFSDGIHCEEKSGKAGERTARKWNSHVKARAVFGIQSRPVHEFGVERRRSRTTTTRSFECGAYQRRASTWALGQVDGTGRRSIHHLRGNTNEPSLLLFRHKSQRTCNTFSALDFSATPRHRHTHGSDWLFYFDDCVCPSYLVFRAQPPGMRQRRRIRSKLFHRRFCVELDDL